MSTAIMEKTASRLSETLRETHNELVSQSDGDRQTTWQEYVEQIKGFDVNDPGDQIKAKAALDALETVLFASVSSISGRTSKF